MTRTPASGAQFELRAGGWHAVVASVGASLRILRRNGRDLVAPFGADELRPAMRGAVLAPWPNRTADGRYAFGGAVHQLPVDDLAAGNASHGLVAWTSFDVARPDAASALLTTTIEPRPGYPWRVRVDVAFALTDDGLRQDVTATNLSAAAAPFGVGGHPYLLAGPASARAIGEWVLTVPADRVLLTSPDRLLPTDLVDVAAFEDGAYDFRSPRRLGDSILNHAFTGLARDADGRTRVRLVDGAGVGAEVELDESCPWVQLYTADELPGTDRRHAVAVEPMTCPPDALNSGIDLRTIPPGGSTIASWSIKAIG
ncbi:aldose 1-epimerase family protein [Microbacterium sp. B2969]|uniref:Aldose 1-epimerase family protein n=1 Tax=Microbacterium alkaliflavum TaxID=3248839 RepID=A0ABW7QE97_9MICO